MKIAKTTPLTKEWRESLKANGYTADAVFRGYPAEELKAKLLSFGGEAVIFLGNLPKQKTLLNKGQLFAGDNLKMWKLGERSCHDNVEYIIGRWPHFKGFTGFALSPDGLWRYHSWVFDPIRNCVRETTAPRLIYYGISF